MKTLTRNDATRLKKQLYELWPHCPLALIIALIGFLNIASGLQLPLIGWPQITVFNGQADSLSSLGGTAQSILGLMLVLVGTGLLWRLVSAWVLSVLLLATTVGATILGGHWGVAATLQTLLLMWLLWSKSYFRRRTALANVVFSLSGIAAILVYGAFGSYLLGKGFHPEIHSLATGFYFTIITLSTAGYGDIVPVSPEARWFVVTLLVIGLGVFASAIASVLGPKISGELNRLLKPKEKIMQPKDHVILVGDGSIALNTAMELKHRKVTFVQIVESTSDASEGEGHRIISGDASDDAIMKEAGIKDARMVIAAREDDGENAFISLVAKDLNPAVQVLAVASSAAAMHRLKLAKADFVFSPAAVGSRLMADWVDGEQLSPAFRDLLAGHPEGK